ncbi:hypothetical protein GYB22_13855 [bacterium]|nr:hypothetical protein [bacterium]
MRLWFFLIASFVLIQSGRAQITYRFNVQSYIGNFPSYGINLPDDTSVYSAEQPGMVFGIKSDCKIGERFSFGMVYGLQHIEVDFLRDSKVIESGKVKKTYLGFRGLVHYGKEPFDLYSGIKLGYVFKRPARVITEQGEMPYLKQLNNDIVFQPGITLIGAFYHFESGFGMGGELSLGSPHVFSLGIRYILKNVSSM